MAEQQKRRGRHSLRGRQRQIIVPDAIWEQVIEAADQDYVTSSQWVREAIMERLERR